MKKYKILILITICLLLGSCSCSLKHKDISERKKYKHYIGQQYEVIGRVDIYGIKQRPSGPLEYYTLVPLPGFSGWEVVSQKNYLLERKSQ